MIIEHNTFAHYYHIELKFPNGNKSTTKAAIFDYVIYLCCVGIFCIERFFNHELIESCMNNWLLLDVVSDMKERIN